MWLRLGWLLFYVGMGAISVSLQGAVVINEIMYNPPGSDYDFEYFELVNTGSATVDLSGWEVTRGITFTFPGGTTLAPGQYLVVCRNTDSIHFHYQITNIIGNFTYTLNNGGDTLCLVDSNTVLIDSVLYYASSPWPTDPDGNGPSLELFNFALDNSLEENWVASDSFGTPGRENSTFITLDSSGFFSPYFNKIVHTSFATEQIASGLSPLSDPLIDLINCADSTLDLCFYDLEDDDVTTAIINAHVHGVRIRAITDNDTTLSPQDSALIAAGITLIDDSFPPESASSYYMHNKFAIVDYRGTGVCANSVWSGSYNWTVRGDTTNANNGIAIKNQTIAGCYTAEFDEMWGSRGSTPDSTSSRFHGQKRDNILHSFMASGNLVELYMSPSDDVDIAMINAIGTADHEIAFCIFAFSHEDVMLAMKDKWDDNIHYPDFMVEGVFDNVNAGSSYSQWHNMSGGSGAYPWSPPADVWIDGQPSGLLHHKYMVIDGHHPNSDPIVITGSTNWSNRAIDHNDENMIIIHDATLANLYLQEFYARKSEAMGNLPPIYDIQWPQPSGEASPYVGQRVIASGVITANFPDTTHRNYMIQGPFSAPWWGIHIYESGAGSNFVVGDSVSVEGTVQEYFGLTEITNPDYTAHGTALIVPEPLLVTTGEVAGKESLESVLVQVENVTVVSEMNPNGEWQIDDGSGVCTVDDMGSYSYVPQLDDEIAELRGVVSYGFGEFKLEPRDDNDIVRTLPAVETLTISRLNSHVSLQWESLGANVLYRIYRDTISTFVPSPATLIDSTTSNIWIDINALSSEDIARYYRITGEN